MGRASSIDTARPPPGDAAPAPATPRLSAKLFGDFRLRLDDADVRPRSRKAAGLLAFLASPQVGVTSRAKLAGMLWSDRGEDQARNSLRQVIAELRGSPGGMAGAIRVTRDAIGYAENMLTSDIAAIGAAAERRDIEEVARRIEQMRGTFLEDLDGLSPAFDDWLMIERSRQEELLVTRLAQVADEMIGQSPPAVLRKVIAALERLAPLDEAVARLGLRLDHAIGDTAALHRRFRRLSDDLAKSLGVRPARETQAVFDALLATPADAPPSAAQQAQPAADRLPPAVLVTAFSHDGRRDSADIAAICSEDIRAALSRNGELRVLMLDGVDPGRAQAVLGSAIGAYRLSGSIRSIGGATTITVELGNITSSFVTWSEQIRIAGSPFEQIDDIIARIVGAIGPAVEQDLSGALALAGGLDDDPREAALLYVRGRRLVREARSLAEARQGADLLESVLRLSPRHVGARMRLSQLYNTDFGFQMAGHDVAGFRKRARLLIEEAAALEPGNVRVQLRLAWCHLRRREWALAERLLRAAVAAMPHDADALNECGFGFACLGELALAETLMQRAFRLNPFAPPEYHADHAVLLALSGQPGAAEEHFEVCTEPRLLYLAVRLGNLARMEGDGARLQRLQREFVDSFMTIWQPAGLPGHADLVSWLDYSVCLRRPDHRQFVLDGIEAAWLTRSQATRDRSA